MYKIVRNLGRLCKIILVFFKHSRPFASDIKRISWSLGSFVYIFAPRVKLGLRKGEHLAAALEELGPIFVKFGQSLSTRADFIGADIVFDLARLRDQVLPFSAIKAREIITEELGSSIDTLFKDFHDQPVASASIAQVHKAITPEGKEVAVKVLRPDIERAFAHDIQLFYWLAALIAKYFKASKRLRLKEVVRTFEEVVRLEMDLRFEAAAADELKENLKDDKFIYIPAVDWKRTARRVLTLEWVHAIPIHDLAALINAGHNLDKIAEKVAISFFNQAYRDGFFHADMHQGNIFVNAKGQLVLVDFGIMGRLDPKTRVYIAEILKGFLERDYLHVAEIHIDAGYVPDYVNVRNFAQACRSIGESIVGLPASQISVAKLLGQLFKVTEDFNMETQPQLLLLQKTTVLVEGVGSSLDPEVNMWKLAEPWIEEWAILNLGIEARILKRLKHVVEIVTEKIPDLLEKKEQQMIITEGPKEDRSKIYIEVAIIAMLTTILTFLVLKHFY